MVSMYPGMKRNRHDFISRIIVAFFCIILHVAFPRYHGTVFAALMVGRSGYEKTQKRSFRFHFPSNTKKLLMSSSTTDLCTAYEWLARQRGNQISDHITWIDPHDLTIPSADPAMGFDIMMVDNAETNKIASSTLRLPIYPVSAVHLPSSATHTFNNIQRRNIDMAMDLKAGRWNLPWLNIRSEKDLSVGDSLLGGYFVVTLMAQDTNRISTIGTLLQVVPPLEERKIYGNEEKLTSVRVRSRARGIVRITGIESSRNAENDYWIGRVDLLEDVTYSECIMDGHDHSVSTNNVENSSTRIDVQAIVDDYNAVRLMYVNPSNGIATRELPMFALNAIQSLPSFSPCDFSSAPSFWDVADCWQTLCNTIREARRSKLIGDLNEIMVASAIKLGGPLRLPIKRQSLPDEVQMQLHKMEHEVSEDFLSCGMDPCLDFQVLLGMLPQNSGNDWFMRNQERVRFLGKLIKNEKQRLETKEQLKLMLLKIDAEQDNSDDHKDKNFE